MSEGMYRVNGVWRKSLRWPLWAQRWKNISVGPWWYKPPGTRYVLPSGGKGRWLFEVRGEGL